MNQQTTKKSLTNRKLMSLCMKYYLSEINGTLLMLFVILTSTITRRISNFFLKKTIYNLSSSESILSNVLKIYALSFLYSCLSSGNDFMLTSFLGIFQHNISIKALHKILTYEAAGQIDLSSGRTQYAISEGSKAMGKLFKHLFVDFVTKVTYLATDIFLINNRLGLVHVFFAIGVALISTAIHLKGAMITIQCKKELNDARGECDKIIYEDIINYETIKSYRTEDLQLEKYKERIRPWRNAYLKHERVKILLAFIHDTIFATTALLFNLYFWKVGTTKQELYKDTYFCLRDLEASIENTSGMYRKYREALVTSNMLIYYLDLIEGFSSGSTIKDSFTDKIVFDNVDFHLGSVSILRKLNFELLRGDKKVIYGRNGSGKSTLFRLMMRLAHQNSGLITIDGININEIEINAYRKLFTYVPQETNLFDDSVINNLTHGNNQSYSEVLKECKKMNIHDDIMRLESGYNTIVGERGCNLNGGLRQKIFYVRAFLTDAPILLFDEPTNNLDEKSADMLIKLILGDSFKDKTVLVICHDHELVQKFPKVLNFVDGILKESQN